jgi:hypothetical protein
VVSVQSWRGRGPAQSRSSSAHSQSWHLYPVTSSVMDGM